MATYRYPRYQARGGWFLAGASQANHPGFFSMVDWSMPENSYTFVGTATWLAYPMFSTVCELSITCSSSQFRLGAWISHGLRNLRSYTGFYFWRKLSLSSLPLLMVGASVLMLFIWFNFGENHDTEHIWNLRNQNEPEYPENFTTIELYLKDKVSLTKTNASCNLMLTK